MSMVSRKNEFFPKRRSCLFFFKNLHEKKVDTTARDN